MVSPWLSLDLTTNSVHTNKNIDMLSTSIIEELPLNALTTADYNKSLAGDIPWFAPMDGPECWFDGLGQVVHDVYIPVGGNEILAGQGAGLAWRLRRRSPLVNLTFEMAEAGAHDFFVVGGWFQEEGSATKRMKHWFKSSVQHG